MSRPMSAPFSRRDALALGLIVVALHAWTFGPALGFGFTDADAWADVAFAREPLSAQLLTRLTGGIAGDDANFWRPAAMIQFWLTRRLAGWDPEIWQLVDLVEHTVATGLAALATALTAAAGRREGAAPRALVWVVTLGFAVHPLTEEVVPAVARSIDLLLGVGVFGALTMLALAERGHRLAWAGFAAFTLVALGAKETGVLLLPLTALWILLFRPTPLRERLLHLARVAAPLLVVVVAYLSVRSHVLDGVGGYYAAVKPEWIRAALARVFIEPFLPAIGAYCPAGRRTLVPLAAVWLTTLYAAWRSPDRRLAAFGALWFLGAASIYVATGTCSRRVFYVPTLGGLWIVVPAMLHAWRRPLGGALTAAYVVAFLYGTPALFRYHQWPEIAAASESLRDPALWRGLPEDSRVWLLDRPFRADLDPRTFTFWGGRSRSLHHGAPAYAFQAWLDEVMPERGLRVATLTGTALLAPFAAQDVTATVADGTLTLVHHGADRQRWDVDSPFIVRTEGDTVRVTPKRPNPRLVVVFATPAGPRAWITDRPALEP